jgi:hypothetical protein
MLTYCQGCECVMGPFDEECPNCNPPVTTCLNCMTERDADGRCYCCPWCFTDLTYATCDCADTAAEATYLYDTRDPEDAY